MLVGISASVCVCVCKCKQLWTYTLVWVRSYWGNCLSGRLSKCARVPVGVSASVCVCARVSMRQLVCAYQGKASEKFVDVTGVGAAAAAAAAATAVAGKHHQASSAISCVCELCVWQVQSQSRKLSMLIEIFCINRRTCAALQLCFPFLCVPFFQKLASRD